MNVSVLGAGLVGSAIVKDLARTGEFEVTAIDVNPAALSDESVAGNTDLERLLHGDAHFPE